MRRSTTHPTRWRRRCATPAPPRIGSWAQSKGRSREHLARQFRSLYGISPVTYRLEAMARRAWRQVLRVEADLADIACDTGFADQAHMTRAVVRLTGSAPGAWRAWARAERGISDAA
jgi:AraC-like DNA-binding protein